MMTVFETVVEPLIQAVTTWLVIALPPSEPCVQRTVADFPLFAVAVPIVGAAGAVGACVGMKGVRIHAIVRELNNENIETNKIVFIKIALLVDFELLQGYRL